jgi:uncharacterized membrane protein
VRAVGETVTVPGTVHEAECCWYEVTRWPAWVDGLARVLQRSDRWPQAGSSVIWESGPAGRGRVRERVVAHEPLEGQTVEVEDDSILGRQTVTFTPASAGVEVTLTLEYEVKQRSLFTRVVDLLFIRGAMERSLRATLTRFAAELEATREPRVG